MFVYFQFLFRGCYSSPHLIVWYLAALQRPHKGTGCEGRFSEDCRYHPSDLPCAGPSEHDSMSQCNVRLYQPDDAGGKSAGRSDQAGPETDGADAEDSKTIGY